jgi:hypothetical protein
MPINIRTERYNLGKILSAGWKLYFEKFNVITPIILIVYIPINIVLSFIPIEPESFEGFAIYLRASQLLEFLFGIIATVAVVKVIECTIKGEEITYLEALKFGLTRWGRAIGVQILAGVIVFCLLLLFIVPGIIWAVYYTFAIYIVAIRDISGKEALNYSKRLVRGQWGRVFWIGLALNLLTVLGAFIIGVIIGIPFALFPGLSISIIDILFDTAGDIAIFMFTIMGAVFFLNVDYLKPNPEETKEIEDASKGGTL